MSDENAPVEQPNPSAPPPASPPSGDVTSDDKLWALLAYVLSPVVPIIILLMQDKKDRPFIKLHNMQALVAGLAAIVILAVIAVIPLVNCFLPVIGLLLWIVLIYWGLQAYNGKEVVIPVISDFVKQQGWA
ncbi:MAG: hypothetical protein FJ011_05715 [Chloroflexi bacterium]|nr:hypothetical protein [Chloroflexota bacterium]